MVRYVLHAEIKIKGTLIFQLVMNKSVSKM